MRCSEHTDEGAERTLRRSAVEGYLLHMIWPCHTWAHNSYSHLQNHDNQNSSMGLGKDPHGPIPAKKSWVLVTWERKIHLSLEMWSPVDCPYPRSWPHTRHIWATIIGPNGEFILSVRVHNKLVGRCTKGYGRMRMASIGWYVWMLGPPLVELIGTWGRIRMCNFVRQGVSLDTPSILSVSLSAYLQI